MPIDTPAVTDALKALNTAAERIWSESHVYWPTLSVETLPSIDSTNSELMRRARNGQLAPTVLMAVTQTAGKGRRGKAWASPAGDSLSFSIGLPLANGVALAGLSLVVGVVLAEQLAPSVQIKWPNDLWVNQQKLAGILVEITSMGNQQYVVIGAGINLKTPQLSDSTAEAMPPIGLNAVCENPPPVATVAHQCVSALIAALHAFQTAGFAPVLPRFNQRDALVNCPVQLSDGQTGVAKGVTAQGALRLARANGTMVDVISQEVSVRPCAL
ncbi:biotin--[acetyl-CoA-carboxylase] ligase [Betaproteobacteria bacterium LSUCC0117]|nr:biotin--[acetyl-CoA-carboxylase] ligase [Betaproteobacteria bacterium LSUCC0117]